MMDNVFVLVCMVFMHIVDDYYLQGILANMKQKAWWEKNAPDPQYKYDYIVALFMHGFSWSFMIQLPIVVFCGKYNLFLMISNAIIHAGIDNDKANNRVFNLIIDQFLHMIQILALWWQVVL